MKTHTSVCNVLTLLDMALTTNFGINLSQLLKKYINMLLKIPPLMCTVTWPGESPDNSLNQACYPSKLTRLFSLHVVVLRLIFGDIPCNITKHFEISIKH